MKIPRTILPNPFRTGITTSMRIMLSVIVLLCGLGVAVALFVHSFTEDLYAEKRQGLQHIVSLAQNAIEPFLEEKRNGKITLAQARIKATEAVERFVYTDTSGANFLFLATYDGYLLVEPSSPEVVGTYQMQRRDREGQLITQALLKKAKSGGGFVEYSEARRPDETAQKKIAFVVGIPELECYLGTGIFVNTLDGAVQKLLIELLSLGFVISLLILGFQYYFLRPLFYTVGVLSDSFKKMSEDPASLLSLNLKNHLHNADTKEMIENFTSMLYRLQSHQDTIANYADNFRQIANAATDVIWQWEASTGKTIWSKNIRNIIGKTPETDCAHFEVIETWVHVNDREMRRQALAAYFAEETESYVCEYKILSFNGSYRFIQARGVATFDEKRAPIRMVGSLIDLTEFMQQPVSPKENAIREISELIPQTIGKLIQQTPSISMETLVIDVKNRLEAEKWQGIVVVKNAVPIGLVMKYSLNQQLSSQYGVSLYYNRSVKMVMDKAPLVVDMDSSLEKVSVLAQCRPEERLYDLIVVTRDGEYIGTVSVMNLLTHLTDLRIQLAANANPLTGLPGNRVIDEKIQLAVRSKKSFAALYLDLDHFKAFNDKYGFERGDAAIKLTADILKEVTAIYETQDAFLGHIGGDDFIMLLSECVPYALIAEQIIQKFDAQIRSLYFPDDLTQGKIVVFNRKGLLNEYPIMSISIAIVDSCCRQFANHLEVAEVAANLKHRAKAMEGSVWVSERRGVKKDVEILQNQ